MTSRELDEMQDYLSNAISRLDVGRLPSGYEAMPFQTVGVDSMLAKYEAWKLDNKKPCVLLGDEMGLGKTWQVLMFMNEVRPLKTLVIAPKSLTYNWQNESNRLLMHGMKSDEMLGIGSLSFCDVSQPFLIVSYEVAARHAKLLASVHWDLIVLDEAHYIKNTSTKRFKGVQLLVKDRSQFLIFATGTPIVNYPIELFPLLHLLDPLRWYSVGNFESRYVWTGARKAQGRNLQELNGILRETCMIRRLKKEVLPDLPAVRRQVIEFPSDGMEELLESERQMYDGRNRGSSTDELAEIIMAVNASGAVEGETDWDAIIETLKCNKKYFFEEMSLMRHRIALAKLPQCLEHIEDVLESHQNGEKLIIFAHHTDVISQTQSFINDYFKMVGKPYTCETMTGADSDRDRQSIVDRFQAEENPKVLICGLKVGGLGYTMTKAHHVIFIEIDWVPGVIAQAEARVDRIGQISKVLVQHLVLKNSMDAVMSKRIIIKQKGINLSINKTRQGLY